MAGHLSCNANYPCRNCMIKKEDLDSIKFGNFPRWSKEKEMFIREHASKLSPEEQEKYLNSFGLLSNYSPLFFLQSLDNTQHLNCRLHIFELGLFVKITKIIKNSLNAAAKREITKLIQESDFSRNQKHLLYLFFTSTKKFGGDDVRNMIYPLTNLFQIIFKKENFKKKFFKEWNTEEGEKILQEIETEFQVKCPMKILLHLWSYYITLYERFSATEYCKTFHNETFQILEKFILLSKIFKSKPLPKIHALYELWLDVLENGPCWTFETSPGESKHKDY
jgi:hypothetical protein